MKDTLKRLIAALLCVLMLNGTLLPSLAAELPEAEPDDETVQETDAPEVLPDEERELPRDEEEPSDLPDDTDTAESPDWTDTPDPIESGALPGEDDTVEIFTDFTGETVTATGEENDTLFYDYMLHAAREQMDNVVLRRPSFAPADHLDDNTRAFFQALVPYIQAVASGERESTVITITYQDAGVKRTCTAEELDMPIKVDGTLSPEAKAAFMNRVRIDANALMDALAAQYPYEMYWYDKTSGMRALYEGITYTSKYISVDRITFRLCVSGDYAPADAQDACTMDTALARAARDTAAAAVEVVNRCEGLCDYDRLVCYRDYICDNVSYNWDDYYASQNGTRAYGNPWQLIWVFDGIESTKVVCEGYAKAFQYLCDLTGFTHPVECRLISGRTTGGHMWNVVEMPDGRNYLVDVTNYDTTGGACYFLGGYSSGSVGSSYTYRYQNSYGDFRSLTYSYQKDMFTIFTEDELTISDAPYEKPSMDDCAVTVYAADYTGVPVQPQLLVRYRGQALVEERDYTVTPNEVTGPGEGRITLTGTGDFQCSRTCTFRIREAGSPSVDLFVSARDRSGTVLGDVDVYPSGALCSGNTVTLTAPVLWGWRFQGWFRDSSVVSTDPVYTFVITDNTELVARFQREYAAVTVRSEAGFRVNGNPQVFTGTRRVNTAVGGQITLTADDSSLFLRWEDENGRLLGTERVLTCTVNNDMDITLVSRSGDAAQVTFRTDYGQVLRSDSLCPGDTIAFPTPPTKAGYDFTGWVFADSGSPASVAGIRRRLGTDSQIDLLPAFAPRSDTCTVVVDADGTETIYDGLSIGSAQSFTAPETAGKTFLKWTDGEGHVLGCERTLFLMVTGDATLRAVYGTAPTQAVPAVTLSPLWLTTVGSTRKISGSANRNVPEGYSVLEAGMLYTVNRALDEDRFVLGGSGVSRYAGAGTDSKGALFLNVKVARRSTVISMRGYVLLREDATGRTDYWYSGIRSACVNDLTTA